MGKSWHEPAQDSNNIRNVRPMGNQQIHNRADSRCIGNILHLRNLLRGCRGHRGWQFETRVYGIIDRCAVCKVVAIKHVRDVLMLWEEEMLLWAVWVISMPSRLEVGPRSCSLNLLASSVLICKMADIDLEARVRLSTKTVTKNLTSPQIHM